MKQLNIRKERIKNNWTLEYVGKEVGLTKTAVHAIETGQRRPSFDILMKLCRLFNVPHKEIERLFTVADENNNLSNE